MFDRKPLVWEEDLELYSKFLDRKVRSGCSLGVRLQSYCGP